MAQEELPKLDELIEDWYDDDKDVTREEFARRILQVFRDSSHDEVYQDILSTFPGEEKQILEQFIEGDIGAKEAGENFAKLQGTASEPPEPENQPSQMSWAENSTNSMKSFSMQEEVTQRKYIKVRK